MNKFMAMVLLLVLCVSGLTVSVQAEETVAVKTGEGASWKMKLKHKDGKEWQGTHEGRTYSLRGDTAFTGVVDDDGDYTVYGTMAPDNTYITTSRVERFNATPSVRVEGRQNGDNQRKNDVPARTEKSEKSEKSEK